MKRKIVLSLILAATSASLALSQGFISFAAKPEEEDSAEDDDEESTALIIFDGGEAYELDNIYVDEGYTSVEVKGPETELIMHGGIFSSGVMEKESPDGELILIGADGAHVIDGASLKVEEDITGADTGAFVTGPSSLEVGGVVSATGSVTTIFTWNEETKEYDIPEIIMEGHGITTDGNSRILVRQNVEGTDAGIVIIPDKDGNKGSITVANTLLTYDDESAAISIYAPDKGDGAVIYEDSDELLSEMPEITVYEISSEESVKVDVRTEDNASANDLKQKILSSINYIIRQDEEAKDNSFMTVSGENIKNIEGFDTVNINKTFDVSAILPKDYTITGGDNVTVTNNYNGTYTLTLTDPKGAINVSAIFVPVEHEDGSITYEADAETDTKTDTETDTVDLSALSLLQYRDSVVDNISRTPSNGSCDIITDNVSFLDTKIINALSARPDIEVNLIFPYSGKRLKVTIPAGYNVHSLLDSSGYCGYLKLLSIFGGTELN